MSSLVMHTADREALMMMRSWIISNMIQRRWKGMMWFAPEWVHLLQMIQFLNLCLERQVGNFKIIGSLRLVVTLESLLSNLLLKVGSAKRSDQVAESFVQSGVESSQEWRLSNFIVQPVPLLDFYCFRCEKIFFRSGLNPSSYNLCSLSSHYVLYCCEKPASISLIISS